MSNNHRLINPSELATSQSGGGKSVPTILNVSKGRSISESVRKASMTVPKKMHFSHISLVVVGEEAAKEGINQIIDALIREPSVTGNLPIVIEKTLPQKKS
jgi:spore germination protein KC